MAQLSLLSPYLQVPAPPSHVCLRSFISPLLFLNRRRSSLLHSPTRSQLSSYPKVRASDISDSQVFLVEEGEGGADEVEEERKRQAELKQKADKIFRDAVTNFAQSDIADAAKKYDMEEELFAEIDFAQIDAFTDRPFAGNPAAVCYLPLKRSDKWLQLVAREFNLSETAFLINRNTRKRRSPVFKKSPVEEAVEADSSNIDEFDLRWFTPKVEVDLCGHATLAAAHLLFSAGIVEGESLLFHTRSGVLKARKVSGYGDDKQDEEKKGNSDEFAVKKKRPIGVGVVELDFPIATFMQSNDDTEVELVSAALGGAKLVWAGKTSLGDHLVELSSSKEIEELRPEFFDMMNLSGRGVIATARADESSGLDFVSRFFAPKVGVPEDPVCGSAHCALGPFWAGRLGKKALQAYQASERGGKLGVRVDEIEGRVYLQGVAVLVMAGVVLNSLRA